MENKTIKGRVLFVGQAYYNAWYLSRELRKIGWKADLLNFDSSKKNQMYYHGEDYKFEYKNLIDIYSQIYFYIDSLNKYDIFHFSNAHGLFFLNFLDYKPKTKVSKSRLISHQLLVGLVVFFIKFIPVRIITKKLSEIGSKKIFDFLEKYYYCIPYRWDIILLKRLGKKIVYSNNGCLDGVSQTSFSKWGPESVCNICRWKNEPTVCSDKRNLEWGKIRNELADYQCLLGGNRVDYNISSKIHEVPQFYCLDPQFWKPNLIIPSKYRLDMKKDVIKIYHAVGNFKERTGENNINIKCTHIYLPLIEKLRKEGYQIELVSPIDVPNKVVRYYQAQSDICVDMLTFGWFGGNIREAMMLGKPCVCYLRPEWLESVKKEIPGYIEELPVISATPNTIYSVLKDLIEHPEKRKKIGQKSREFALKWHSSQSAARRFDIIYSSLLN